MAETKIYRGIIVLIGLPGSGKSTLARNLQNGARSKFHLPQEAVKLIQYDEIYEGISQESKGDSFDAILWHKSRVSAFSDASSFVSAATNTSRTEPVLVIIDDNMFYRSMRFPYYKLARKHQIGFIQLYLNAPIELCIVRDSQRSKPVSAATIRRMQERLEPPEAINFAWEALLDRIFASFSHLPPPLSDSATDEAERQSAREKNVKSFVHQLDLQLRKIVSQALSADLHQDIKKQLGPQIHKVKQQFLDHAVTLYEVEEGESVLEACSRAATEFSNQIDTILQKFS